MVGAIIGGLLGMAFGKTLVAWGLVKTVGLGWLWGASVGSLFDQPSVDFSASSPNYSFSEISNTKSQLLPVPIVYGRVRMAGNIFMQQFYDDNRQKMDMFVGLGRGPINRVVSVYANEYVLYGDGSDTQMYWMLINNEWVEGTYAEYVAFEGTKEIRDEDGNPVTVNLQECSCDIHLGEATQTKDSREPADFAYPGVAYLGLTLKVQDGLTGNPTITTELEGRKLWTPSGTRYTNNPVWCIWDLLTNTEFGVGIPADAMNLAAAEAAAAYCDALVDGKPRYTLGYIIDQQRPAPDILRDMCMCFDGYFREREKIEICVNRPVAAPSKAIDVATSAVKGTFSWQQKSREETYNRIVLEWVDPNNHYERTSSPFENDADILERGVYERNLSLLGVTDATQAARLGEQALNYAQKIHNFCTFDVSVKDFDIEVGDVVSITESAVAGWTNKWFHVLDIQENAEREEATITFVEYAADAYVDTPTIPIVTPDNPEPTPAADDYSNLLLTDVGTQQEDGTYVPRIRVRFTPPAGSMKEHVVNWWHDEESVLEKKVSPSVTDVLISEGIRTGVTLNVRVWGTDVNGKKRTGVIGQIVPGKDDVAPGAPTNLTATGWFGSIWLNWVNPAQNADGTPCTDLAYIEIWENDENIRDGENGAIKIAEVNGTSYNRHLGSFEGRYYWARAVDMSGNIGPWNAAAGVYGYSEQASHQDFVDELIEQSPYLQEAISDLNTPIESLQGSVEDLLSDVADIQVDVADALNGIVGIKDIEIPDIDSRVARAADRADELIGDALLRLQIAQRDTRAIVRDAGIQVDPESGKVVISALETLRLESGLQMSNVNALFDAQDAKIELKASRTYVDTLAQEIMNGFAPTYAYEYNGTAEEWTADAGTTLTQGASSVVLETTTSATWTSPDIEFAGADNPTCTIRIRRTDGETWGVALQWKTAELPYSTERQLAVTEPSMPGNWNSLQVRTSSDAWDAATVTGIRFIFSDATKYEIDSISVGKSMLQELLFKDLELRITQAEIDIDGALASITLKADSTELNALGARITQAEIDIDGVEGSIGLMATKTELEDMGDDVEARFTSVGLELNAAKGLIAQEVIAAQSIYGDTEAAAQALLRGLLFGQGQFGKVKQNLAYAREQLTATINEKLEAEAAYRLTLAAQIDDNTAAIRNESTARATADEAMASQIMSMGATVEQNSALIETEMTIRADAISAEASARETLAAYIGDPEDPDAGTVFAAIVTERSARVLADSAEATARQTLAATVSSNTSAIQTEATTRANADSAEATARQTLAATVSSNTSAIQTEATTRANADSAEATARQTLAAVVGSPLVSGQSAFAAIQNEQTVRATADSANASSISTLQTTVGGHTSSISTLNTSVNGIKSKHAVKLDTNGYVGGLEIIGTGNQVDMVFATDTFLIVAPGSTPSNATSPFAMGYTFDANGNRVYKVSMDKTFIQEASILNGHINDLTIGHIKLASGADCALTWGDGNYYNWDEFIYGTMGYLTTTPTTPQGGDITINVTGASRVLLWGICRGVISGNQIWSGIYKGGTLLQHMGGIGSESTMTGMAVDANPGLYNKTYSVKAWLTAGAGNVLTSCGITALAFYR